MDAVGLLREVPEAYRNLQTLMLEAGIINESGDENEHYRSERVASPKGEVQTSCKLRVG